MLACDFDGTGAVDGHLAPEITAAFAEARARGILTPLVVVSLASMLRRDGAPAWQQFTPAARVLPHVHHARKYVDERLPPDKRFYFRGTPVPVVACNVGSFCGAVLRVPTASLRHHLRAGDFSRWAADVLSDPQLAAGLRKIEQTSRTTERVSSVEVVKHFRDRYAL